MLLAIVLAGMVFTGCAGMQLSKTRSSQNSRQVAALGDSPSSPWRPTQKHSIPVTMTPQVQQWVNLFQGRLKPHFDRWFYRLGQYGPTIQKVLDEEGVPRDLIYLSMIESGFNLKARSHASAVGPWQFIGSTGRMYGLKADFFVDDRSDLITASHAAARHLRDLYNTFGDWYLAFAAYNAGPGTVNRAIRGTGSKNFWTHARSRYLRAETKNYVPKILAALHIVKNYHRFGYSDKDFGKPLQYDRVFVPDATDITVIAKSAGVPVDVIQDLNPSLVSGITRPGAKVPVYIPKGRKEMFKTRYAGIPEDRRVENLYYNVGPRDSLHTIAKNYHTTPAKLAHANGLSATARLAPGSAIKIPTNKRVLLALAERSGQSRGVAGRAQYYRVRRGDSLGLIARRNRTSVGQLARLNRISTRASLRVGQTLKIRNGAVTSSPVYAGLAPAGSPGRRASGVAYIIQQEKVSPTNTLNAAVPETDSFFYADVAEAPSPDSNSLPINTASASIANIIAMNNNSDDTANDIQPGIVHVSDEVENSDLTDIPGAAISLSSPGVRNVPPRYHTVHRGETLSTIANRYRIGVSQLKFMNKLRSDRIRINQRLLVSQTRQINLASQKPLIKKPQTASFILHRIRSGETLWSLSKRYGVTVNDIKNWNQMRGNSLKVNQKVKIQQRGRSRSGVALTL